MSRPAKPAPVQFYLDADVLGLAKILVQVRGDVTYPGDPGGPVKGGRVRPACTIKDTATRDSVWIPETARQGWFIITRDPADSERRAEIDAVRTSGCPHDHPGRGGSSGYLQPA
jgi:PIN like domain